MLGVVFDTHCKLKFFHKYFWFLIEKALFCTVHAAQDGLWPHYITNAEVKYLNIV